MSIKALSLAIILKDVEDLIWEIEEEKDEETVSLEQFTHLYIAFQMGNYEFRNNHFPEAISYYSLAANIKPLDPIILCNRSTAYIRFCQLVIKRRPSNSLGLEYTEHARLALQDAEMAMDLQNDSVTAYMLRAVALILLERLELAHDVILSGLRADPLSIPLQNLASITASTIGRRSHGITSYIQTMGQTIPFSAITSRAFLRSVINDMLYDAATDIHVMIEAPKIETQSTIHSFIQSLALDNIETMANSFSQLVDENFYFWFGRCMIKTRVSIESNHAVCLAFLRKVCSEQLNAQILEATFENCKIMLKSENLKKSSEERKMLKNLGSWLGELTIAQNRVLLARKLDPKQLIAEAYERDVLLAVVPFICQLMRQSRGSMAYSYPNPWTAGILKLLKEIYLLPNQKGGLIYEITVLLNHLQVDIEELPPTTLLQDCSREGERDRMRDEGSQQDENCPPLVESEDVDMSTEMKLEVEGVKTKQSECDFDCLAFIMEEDSGVVDCSYTEKIDEQGDEDGKDDYPLLVESGDVDMSAEVKLEVDGVKTTQRECSVFACLAFIMVIVSVLIAFIFFS